MLATGAGAASRQSIGTTVFGGMLAATILSLLCVPVFYAVIEQLRDRRASKNAEPAASLKTTAPAE
jgi:Cu/Ag efflux pump CusA